jgi:hypothetical protein
MLMKEDADEGGRRKEEEGKRMLMKCNIAIPNLFCYLLAVVL